ncbi:MAG: peptidoglycan-binding protein [Clostridiales bacterium]|nr:peptidoglycan-binding protein [Clostridiales bacterium]
MVVGGTLTAEDTAKDDPEGTGQAVEADGAVDVSGFFAVKRGCKGGAVRRLQTWLNDLGGGTLLLRDGDFGPATEEAVRAFQTEHGLTADGFVGRKTWEALAEARQAAMVTQAVTEQ